MTLPAFAAERRAAAPLLLRAGVRRCRSISPSAQRSAANPPHAADGTMGQTDGQTDARPLHTVTLFKRHHSSKHCWQFYRQDGGKNQLA